MNIITSMILLIGYATRQVSRVILQFIGSCKEANKKLPTGLFSKLALKNAYINTIS